MNKNKRKSFEKIKIKIKISTKHKKIRKIYELNDMKIGKVLSFC